LNAAREETLLLIALCMASYFIIQTFGTETLDLLVWAIMLLIQAIPYAATLIMSLISSLPGFPASWIGETGSMHQAARTLLEPPTANSNK
jgi:hypothetical protein